MLGGVVLRLGRRRAGFGDELRNGRLRCGRWRASKSVSFPLLSVCLQENTLVER